MNASLLPASMLLFICVLFYGCADETNHEVQYKKFKSRISETYAYEKTDSLFLNELSCRKIIMINDANHGQAYFMLRVTRFLNHWLNHIPSESRSDSLPRKIVLFLECNKDAERAINEYLRTGEVSAFLQTNIEFDLEAHSNIFTIDYMIFMNELRKISQRIDRINQRFKSDNIQFIIRGAESDPPFYKKIHKIDRQRLRSAQQSWFAKRDKICSENIESFLKDSCEYKAIVFYGSAHLLRSKANKSFDQNMLDPSIYDYYLGYYLDSIFGRENVSIFWYASNPWTETEKIDKIGDQKDRPDFIISSKPIPGAPVPFTIAKTKTYLNALYEIMMKYVESEKDREIQLAKVALFKLNTDILRAMPVKARKINLQFERLRHKKTDVKRFITLVRDFLKTYDVVEGLREIPHTINYTNYPDSMIYNRELFLMLTNIPVLSIEWPRQNLHSDAFGKLLRSKSKSINEKMTDIQRFIAVYQLFIATEDEKKTILNYLKEELEFNDESNDSWLNWLYSSINSQTVYPGL